MRTTICLPDADYQALEALAAEERRSLSEMLVLLLQESLQRRTHGAQRVARFRTAMKTIYGGLDEIAVRSLDGRERERRSSRS